MTTRTMMGGIAALALAAGLSACSQATDTPAAGTPAGSPAASGPAVPYKLGTFERQGQAFLGLVLRDSQVVDIAQANAAFEGSNASAARLAAPADMKALITAYDGGWKDRLGAIARTIPAEGAGPAYAYALDGLKVLPPVRPALILNAGGNYTEHTQGIAAQQQQIGRAHV